MQKLLIGEPEQEEEWGTGAIPGALLRRMRRSQGLANGIDGVTVKHVSGFNSTLLFKSYEQGPRRLAGRDAARGLVRRGTADGCLHGGPDADQCDRWDRDDHVHASADCRTWYGCSCPKVTSRRSSDESRPPRPPLGAGRLPPVVTGGNSNASNAFGPERVTRRAFSGRAFKPVFRMLTPRSRRRKDLSHLPMDSPVDICAEDGVVIFRCGDGCACTFSADAAVIASDRLFAAGLTAKRQAGGTDTEEEWDGP